MTAGGWPRLGRCSPRRSSGPRRLVLYAPDADPSPACAQVFQSNLKRLGIDVDIASFRVEAFFERIATRGEPYDVVLNGWVPDYADPVVFFNKL